MFFRGGVVTDWTVQLVSLKSPSLSTTRPSVVTVAGRCSPVSVCVTVTCFWHGGAVSGIV